MTKRYFAATSIAAAITFAGCGSSSGGGDNKALTYSGFGTAANKVCSSQNTKVQAISKDLNGDPKNDAPIYDKLVPALEAANNEFKALKPPEALKVDFDKFNSITDQQIAIAKQAQTDAKSGDQKTYIATVQKLQPLAAQSNAEASKLGAKDCINT